MSLFLLRTKSPKPHSSFQFEWTGGGGSLNRGVTKLWPNKVVKGQLCVCVRAKLINAPVNTMDGETRVTFHIVTPNNKQYQTQCEQYFGVQAARAHTVYVHSNHFLLYSFSRFIVSSYITWRFLCAGPCSVLLTVNNKSLREYWINNFYDGTIIIIITHLRIVQDHRFKQVSWSSVASPEVLRRPIRVRIDRI